MQMNQLIQEQLQQGGTIDITTTGRKSGKPHRIEIGFQNINGTVYISGLPGKRDWYANLVANPEFTFHLKQPVNADLRAHARPITDPDERREILAPFTANWNYANDLETWLEKSPLVAVSFDE